MNIQLWLDARCITIPPLPTLKRLVLLIVIIWVLVGNIEMALFQAIVNQSH
ncbi:hypothetical protein SAMN05421504_103890 [Amycolatopsis xylanica]|uniref:Uncharacterized protein n=1 Tax=Amycolatopsis xylanica TaxID=589385 RepID=A0A1H3EMQ6_9PSEU|nr:hypothetical protein SAMN05421504_103890 [Amycolatopsis xylanica]